MDGQWEDKWEFKEQKCKENTPKDKEFQLYTLTIIFILFLQTVSSRRFKLQF